jgi:hypothetical protein
VALLAACREPLLTISGGPARASLSRAEQLFAALGARVTLPVLDPKYDSARVKIANGALIPSRIWDDTSVWTATTASRRTLGIAGRYSGGRYRLEAARTIPAPALPAESRHIINLTRLSDDEFGWDTDVYYALGTSSVTEISGLISGLFASAEGRSESDIRADYRAVAPKTAAVLGQLFTVDSIRTTQLQDRSTMAMYAVTMRPGGVSARYPNFAEYLRRYAGTARTHWTLNDASGASYLEASAVEGRLKLRVRALDGRLVALSGPPRAMPDSLTLNGDLTLKIRRFTVGVRDFHADFTILRTDHERGVSIVGRVEPEWVLPLIGERMLRTPLRRPFQARGVLFRLAVRDSAGAQTILNRRMHLEVQESAILRFIGRLGAVAVGEYQGSAEREQLAWLREVVNALSADLAVLGSPP